MASKEATRHSGNCERVRVSTTRDIQIVSNGWTEAQTRAIEIGVGGGFLLMAVLAVML